MQSAENVLDKKVMSAFPKPLQCNSKSASYADLLLKRRSGIKNAELSNYTITDQSIVTGGSGYVAGEYIEIDYGSPKILAYVISVVGGAITSFAIINKPDYASLPSNPATSTTQTGEGIDATFSFTVQNTSAIQSCCTCTL